MRAKHSLALAASFALAAWLGLAAPALAETVTVPSEFHGGLVFVHVAIDGERDGLFVLDTGAAGTVIDTAYAQGAKLRLGDPIHLRGGGGELAARQAQDVPLALAGLPPLLTDPTVADLAPIGRAMGVRIDGILGDDVLRRFVVTLDYRSEAVRLSSADQQTPPADAAPMRFIGTPFVSALVEDGGRRQAAAFQIDTGSNSAVELWAPFADAAFPHAATRPGAGLGVGGEMRTRRGRIDALTVAGRRLTGLDANFDDRSRPDDAGPNFGGVIGGPAWTGLVLTLDFPRRRVWVR